MATYFFYDAIKWDNRKNEINFVRPFLSNGKGKRYQVDRVKNVVTRGQILYLCKVNALVGHQKTEVFKLYVLDDYNIGNFDKESIQIVGKNVGGRFLFEKEFADAMKKNVKAEMVDRVKLSDMRSSNEQSKNSKGIKNIKNN